MSEQQRPCDTCGAMVDLSTQITVKIAEPDGSEVETQMTEWEARELLDELGLPLPPVLCENEERVPITTEAAGVS